MKRLATALVLIPFVTWLVLAGPQWAFEAAVAAVGLVAFHEFDKIAAENNLTRASWTGMVAGLALLFAPLPGLVVVLVALLAMLLALRVSDLKDAMAAAAVFTLGVVYIFGSWRCAIDLRAVNPHWLMFALLLSWAGDTAALYVGRAFGRHRMAPRVSPQKTWEGAAGSVAGGILAGAVYAHFLIPSAGLAIVIPLAAAGNIAGQAGDLYESAISGEPV
jgi:phosphatidate cytidylyltransferase